jgi:large subunit ribosomal protein L36e
VQTANFRGEVRPLNEPKNFCSLLLRFVLYPALTLVILIRFDFRYLKMTAAVEGLSRGLNKGFLVTKNNRQPKPSRHRGRLTRKVKVCREVVREITGFAPYERRVMELLRIARDKKALKFLKKRIGQHQRAKKKRDEMQNVITTMRKHQAHK